ncbi:MAG: ComF family protein [Flavobacteriaceae bacterium]
MKNLIKPTLGAFVSLFFPKLCPGCMNPLYGTEKIVCFDCQLSLPQTDHPWDHHNLLWERINERLKVERAVSLFDFKKRSRVASLLYQLKYRGQEEIGAFLGDWLGPLLRQSSVFGEVDAVLPLPLHPKRLRQRGYNQVQLFSKSLAKHLKLPLIDDLVYRKKQTRQLAKMQGLDCFKEVDEAFAIRQNNLYPPQHWLLVDDVITTGATIVSCGKTILEDCGGRLSIVSLASRLS